MTLVLAMGYGTKRTGNKRKNKSVGLHQIKKLSQSKGNSQNGREYFQTIYLIKG